MTDGTLSGLSSVLLERDSEIAQVGLGLTALDTGKGGVLAVEAASGLGKSSLLKLLRDRAASAGFCVLSARGNELEHNYAFGVLAQLLETDMDDHERGNDPALANAEADWPATLRYLQSRLFDRASGSRLVIVVDDVRWVDEPSLRLLSYLAARAERLPLLLAFALDTADSGPATDWLCGASMSPGATVLRPAPLSQHATKELVSVVLGDSVAAVIADACFDASAGNLFLLREIVDEAATGRLGSVESVPSWLPRHAPDGVVRRLVRRLRCLPVTAHAVARAVAVLGTADPVVVARTVDCPDNEFDAAVAALIDAEIMADAPVLRFAQPILCTALYAKIPTVSRSRMHARAARALIEVGASDYEVATQLASARPSGERWVADKLVELDGEVAGGVGPAMAAGTDCDVEVLLERAWALILDCRFEQAMVLLCKGRAESQGPDASARIETISACLAELSLSAQALHRAEVVSETHSLKLGTRGVETMSADQLAVLAEQMLSKPAGDLSSIVVGLVAAGALGWGDRLSAARQAVVELSGVARELGVDLNCVDLALLAAIDYQLGDIGSAEKLTEQVLSDGGVAGPPRLARLLATVVAVHVFIEQGGFASAEVAIANLDLSDKSAGSAATREAEADSVMELALLYARGRLRAAQGDVGRVLGDLFCGRRLAVRFGLPLRALVSWSPAVTALNILGRTDEALAMGREELSLARSFGTSRLLATALCTLGSVMPGPAALSLIEEAAELMEGSSSPVERARTQLMYGEVLRGAGKDIAARHQLRLAAGAARSCGAFVLHRRALEELRLIDAGGSDSGWPPPVLTPRQYEVAELAAEGMANQEIARTLFVTIKTVEWHLTQAYRKLSVESRSALSAALAASTPAGTASDTEQTLGSTGGAPTGSAWS